jgi:superkiller protein 3
VYTGYASALRLRGKNAEAEAMLKRGTPMNGAGADSAYGLCSMYITQKNLAKLRPVCQTAIAGLSSQALGTLGYELSEIKEYALAEAAYRKAVERGPDPGNVSEANLANTLLQEGKASEAAEIYMRRLARNPGDSLDREQYAAALEAAGDLKNAEAQYLQAAQHKDCETLSALGRLYLHEKRVQEAFEQFDRALQDQWDCPTPVYFLTQQPRAFGAQQREIPQFEEKILARARPKPEEKVANTWYRFANLAHDFGHNEDAATAYRKAADLDPKQAFPLGGLGWALHDAGRHREAIAAFEEAEKRQPGYLKSAPEVQKRYEQSLAAVQGKKP